MLASQGVSIKNDILKIRRHRLFTRNIIQSKLMRLSSSQSDSQYPYSLHQEGLKVNKYYQLSDSKKNKKKLVPGNRIHDFPKSSTYSSSSRLTSYIKGNSIHQQTDLNFKSQQSLHLNALTEKYLQANMPPQKLVDQMQDILQKKKDQLNALRVHRDQMKFMSYNNPYDTPIKISLHILKQKAKMEEKVKDIMADLTRDMKQMDTQISTMNSYYSYLTSFLSNQNQDELILDTLEEEQLRNQNLQRQVEHLQRVFKQEDMKNAKQIKALQDQITDLRISIKKKEDRIRDLKSKICTMYIKLNSRNNSSSKDRNMSLSIRKFNSQKNNYLQQAYMGNTNFKKFSKQVLQKVTSQQELNKIIFYLDDKGHLSFQCVYKDKVGCLHSHYAHFEEDLEEFEAKRKANKLQVFQIKVKYLMSLKFFFKAQIVGVQCRLKSSQKSNKHLMIGDCKSNIQHQLLTLVNKKIVTLGSFWQKKSMIGVSVWYINSLRNLRKYGSNKNLHSIKNTGKQSVNQYYK